MTVNVLKNKKFLLLSCGFIALALFVSSVVLFKHYQKTKVSTPALSAHAASAQQIISESKPNISKVLTPSDHALGDSCEKLSVVWGMIGSPGVVDGTPQTVEQKLYEGAKKLCYHDYFSYYSPQLKIPLYSAQIIYPNSSYQEPRTDDFMQDPSLNSLSQAKNQDYLKTGFDRGHLAPAANMSSADGQAVAQSFYFTNIAPQVVSLNRGIWKRLEFKITSSAQSSAKLVYTGVVPGSETIGKSEVNVPTYFYKAVLDLKDFSQTYYLMPNVPIVTQHTKKLPPGNPSYPVTTPSMSYNCNSYCDLNNFALTREQFTEKTKINHFPKLK